MPITALKISNVLEKKTISKIVSIYQEILNQEILNQEKNSETLVKKPPQVRSSERYGRIIFDTRDANHRPHKVIPLQESPKPWNDEVSPAKWRCPKSKLTDKKQASFKLFNCDSDSPIKSVRYWRMLGHYSIEFRDANSFDAFYDRLSVGKKPSDLELMFNYIEFNEREGNAKGKFISSLEMLHKQQKLDITFLNDIFIKMGKPVISFSKTKAKKQQYKPLSIKKRPISTSEDNSSNLRGDTTSSTTPAWDGDIDNEFPCHNSGNTKVYTRLQDFISGKDVSLSVDLEKFSKSAHLKQHTPKSHDSSGPCHKSEGPKAYTGPQDSSLVRLVIFSGDLKKFLSESRKFPKNTRLKDRTLADPYNPGAVVVRKQLKV